MTEAPVDQGRRDCDAILEALGNASFRFWLCPTPGHSDRRGPGGQPVVTVEWRGGTAYCTSPDCDRNSQQNTTENG